MFSPFFQFAGRIASAPSIRPALSSKLTSTSFVQRAYHGGGPSYSTKSSNVLSSSETQGKSKYARTMEQLGIAPNGSTIKPFRQPRRKNPIRRYPDRRRKMDMLKANAIHVGQTIDLAKVKDYVFSDSIANLFGKNSLVVELPHSAVTLEGESTIQAETRSSSSRDEHFPGPRYLAVFRFGSVVGINLSTDEFQSYLGRIDLFVHNPVMKGSERREDFGIMLAPNSVKHRDESPYHSNKQVNNMMVMANARPIPIVNGDYCVVSDLDLKGISVISNILAQTTALDTYNDTVDSMLNKFAEMNTAVQTSGTLQSRDKKFLFKTFAQNNAIFIDLISKIRLKDRSDTAWNNSKYENIHYGLKEEFEIEDRFDQVEYKLNLIQQVCDK